MSDTNGNTHPMYNLTDDELNQTISEGTIAKNAFEASRTADTNTQPTKEQQERSCRTPTTSRALHRKRFLQRPSSQT